MWAVNYLLNFHQNPLRQGQRGYHYPHFTGEKTKAEAGKMISTFLMLLKWMQIRTMSLSTEEGKMGIMWSVSGAVQRW